MGVAFRAPRAPIERPKRPSSRFSFYRRRGRRVGGGTGGGIRTYIAIYRGGSGIAGGGIDRLGSSRGGVGDRGGLETYIASYEYGIGGVGSYISI